MDVEEVLKDITNITISKVTIDKQDTIVLLYSGVLSKTRRENLVNYWKEATKLSNHVVLLDDNIKIGIIANESSNK